MPGSYADNVWIDTKTGEQQSCAEVIVDSDELAEKAPDKRRVGTRGVDFTPPNTSTDWGLLLRTVAR